MGTKIWKENYLYLMDHPTDLTYMRRALELASIGSKDASPNPMVGCVIVHNGKIIGEGWHQKYGGPHAEVNAVASVEDQSLLSESTVYVTLEPCAHHGKTPPCADLLVEHKVKKVVIANEDPFPLVNGGGIEKLKAAGIEVQIGPQNKDGLNLNRRFFHVQKKRRPFVVLKWAQTADGYVARENYDSKWISNAYSRKLVHKWRAEEDAILVGKNTVKYDDPALTVRGWEGDHPLRVFIDRNLELPNELKLKDGALPTICYNLKKSETLDNLEYVKLPKIDFMKSLLEDLFRRKVQSVLVEGGSAILHDVIDSRLWDEARIFISENEFRVGIPAPRLIGNQISTQNIEGDKLMVFKPYA
ncbi:bifunctional diaminohydroxyphosphoribosylaminopyrimidine deaminase/5-amino-6-(5-phosphoribosylamino)uracil reductase RibD [Reichenbachiella ulvae]|uniref:Riboflavin biosynthesis protein RibD n=1 Tax=Reichenbachiella ulvae TaxID=2980104 RepID=A0ABT3CZT9_9BACT|nr:bifunctional diaminohydroxyphosphoribosylaminopyrimidine deaminase/5-amino-6-(5-phosphoribosylamino)uracil reductase RibD [Reichenbachiella ulvae]MCV9389211.1 bifunctional diaminohydroxyphosphoribosylaminopyrimidine deaminase/5-amino-6-(5-phosphoribosylamino)uracil reductase RibD [Reichenbachiella ulvae]